MEKRCRLRKMFILNFENTSFKPVISKKSFFLDKGLFNKTDIDTLIIFFEKKFFFNDSNDYHTKNIDFYDFNFGNIKLSCSASIDQLIDNNFIFSSSNYLDKNNYEHFFLGDVCQIVINNFKRSAKYGNEFGAYKFYSSKNGSNSFFDVPDFKDDDFLIFGHGGSPNINYDNCFSCSDHCSVWKLKDEFKNNFFYGDTYITLKYIYTYLKYNLHEMDIFFWGCGVKHISINDIKKIKIKYPKHDLNHIYSKIEEYNQDLINYENEIIETKKKFNLLF